MLGEKERKNREMGTTEEPKVKLISECFIKPHKTVEESKKPLHLTPWDLVMLSVQYIQKGLLFAKPSHHSDSRGHTSNFMSPDIPKLKHSLSVALTHFYPLAGRFKTVKTDDPPSYSVHVDCNDGPGAKFIHATLDMTVSDILSPTDVPKIVHSFFDVDHYKAVNHDGHTLSLLSVQVTELIDGVFIGCSMSHAICDGTSYWNFWKTWSEIFLSENPDEAIISRPPIFERWFPEGHGPIINLPYKHHSDFIDRLESPPVRERIFHFSPESLAALKSKANAEIGTTKISSFQAFSALVWRSVVLCQHFPPEQNTGCRLAANNRPRLRPPVSENCFGNLIFPIRTSTTVRELAEHGLGWAAWKVHEAVVGHNDGAVRAHLAAWLESPRVFKLGQLFDPYSVMMGSSARFDKYGSEFGMGRAVAVRSGFGNKVSGKMTCYPGREGGGSIDLEVCLSPEAMRGLEADPDFMDAAGLRPIPL